MTWDRYEKADLKKTLDNILKELEKNNSNKKEEAILKELGQLNNKFDILIKFLEIEKKR